MRLLLFLKQKKEGEVFGWVDHQQVKQTFFFFTSLLCKTLMRLCSVNIEKKRHMLLPKTNIVVRGPKFKRLAKNKKLKSNQ